MRPAVLVLAASRERLRATLDALWSEDPAIPADVVVLGDPSCSALARREHAGRVRVVESGAGRPWGPILNRLVGSLRNRFLVLLAAGTRPTPGWLRELTVVAERHGIVAPRLPLAAAEGPQAAAVPDRPSRRELRRAATRLRFLEPRFESVDVLAPACIGMPRNTLQRVGRFDARYESLEGVVFDIQRRVRAKGGRLLLARRALVCARPSARLPDGDREALSRREPFFLALEEECPPVALELEADDPAHGRLRDLANGLVARGVPVSTFSRRGRLPERPSDAPHVQAATVDGAARGAALALVRGDSGTSPRRLRVEFSDARASGPPAEGVLGLVDSDGEETERLDDWALEVCAAARAATGGPVP